MGNRVRNNPYFTEAQIRDTVLGELVERFDAYDIVLAIAIEAALATTVKLWNAKELVETFKVADAAARVRQEIMKEIGDGQQVS